MAAPTTSTLDTFVRANGALGANWGIMDPNFGSHSIISNLAAGVASNWASNYWTPATFAADQECWVTGMANLGYLGLYVRASNPNTTTLNAYAGVCDAGGSRTSIWRITNNAFSTQLSGYVACANVTGLWMQAIGTTLNFYFQSGGVWTLNSTITDSTYSGVGRVGWQTFSGTSPVTINGFAGGAVGGTPTITSFSPASGPIGTLVTITGTNLTGAFVVTFNHGSSVTPTVQSSTQITATVPSDGTTGVVGLTTPSGTVFSSNSFTVTAAGAPTISSFSPTIGPVGTTVTVNGTGFTSATIASVNSGTTVPVTVISDTQLTFVVPNGATSGVVKVTSPSGTATSSGTFTIGAGGPTITSFSPTSGPPGTTGIVITGTNFDGATQVLFNGVPASFTIQAPATFKVRGMFNFVVSSMAADWLNIIPYGFNTIICAAQDPATINELASTNTYAWVTVGNWIDSSGSFSLSDSQAVSDAGVAVASGRIKGFYIADEPTNSAQNIATIKARSNLLKNAYPGIETIVAYFDAASLPSWKGAADAFALDIYPSRFGFNNNLITQLAASADGAGIKYYGVPGAFTDGTSNYPLPTPTQLQDILNAWSATNQAGYAVYAWGPTGASTPNQLQNQSGLLSVLQAYNAI